MLPGVSVNEFEEADGNKYDIRKGIISYNTDFTVYKFHCSYCSKQHLGNNKEEANFGIKPIN